MPNSSHCMLHTHTSPLPLWQPHTDTHTLSAVKHNNIWFQFRFWFWFSVNHLKLTFFWSPQSPLNANGFKFVFYLCSKRAVQLAMTKCIMPRKCRLMGPFVGGHSCRPLNANRVICRSMGISDVSRWTNDALINAAHNLVCVANATWNRNHL